MGSTFLSSPRSWSPLLVSYAQKTLAHLARSQLLITLFPLDGEGWMGEKTRRPTFSCEYSRPPVHTSLLFLITRPHRYCPVLEEKQNHRDIENLNHIASKSSFPMGVVAWRSDRIG